MKTVFFCIILFIVARSASAQKKNSRDGWKFHSINAVGFLEGQAGSAFQLQTVNGAKYKSWFGGIGVGLDYYRYRTVPLFFDLRKEFFSGTDKLFVYADAGFSFSWVADDQKDNYLAAKFSNGFYNDMGLGYKRNISKNNAIIVSAGYSFKKLVETYNQMYFGPLITLGSGPEYPPQQINYSLNRLSIKIGWEF
jgi:hypothetical protein